MTTKLELVAVEHDELTAVEGGGAFDLSSAVDVIRTTVSKAVNFVGNVVKNITNNITNTNNVQGNGNTVGGSTTVIQ